VRYAYAILQKRNSSRLKRPTRVRQADAVRIGLQRPANKGLRYPAEILTADEVIGAREAARPIRRPRGPPENTELG